MPETIYRCSQCHNQGTEDHFHPRVGDWEQYAVWGHKYTDLECTACGGLVYPYKPEETSLE